MPALPDPIAGLRWRHASPDDAVALAELDAACFVADRGLLATASEYREELTHPANDPGADVLVAEADDGSLAAFGYCFMTGSDRSKHRAFPWGHVRPDHRRRGIGSAVLAWQEARCRERFAESDDQRDRVIRVDAYDTQTDRMRLFVRHGFEPARYFVEMLRDLAEPIDDVASPITLQPWSDEVQAVALGVHNQAFADHWGSEPVGADGWEHRFGEFFVPDASFLACDGDVPVGYVSSGVFPHDFESRGRKEGWIESLGVIRSHRRRGVGSALLTAAMRALRARDLEFAALGVDSASPTGAVGVYERLGFRPDRTSITYAKWV